MRVRIQAKNGSYYCGQCRRDKERAQRNYGSMLALSLDEEISITPVPGSDYARIKGTGGYGNYTFHLGLDRSAISVLRQGGLDAEELIDEWFEYEYNNRRACEEYDRTVETADMHYEKWNKKWMKEAQNLSIISAASSVSENCLTSSNAA